MLWFKYRIEVRCIFEGSRAGEQLPRQNHNMTRIERAYALQYKSKMPPDMQVENKMM